MISNFAKTPIDRSKVAHPLLALAAVICDEGRFSRAGDGRIEILSMMFVFGDLARVVRYYLNGMFCHVINDLQIFHKL